VPQAVKVTPAAGLLGKQQGHGPAAMMETVVAMGNHLTE
jgi:hypothetical protein